jgi:hypothetical protein
MGLEANGSFGYGSSSSGGGGGEVNTASNVGLGAQLFKQKVGADLQFRTLQESPNQAVKINQLADEVEIGLQTDIFGISNAFGYYDLFSDLQTAILAANVGQTVTFFDDYIETNPIPIGLSDRVHIDLNGHSYTLDSPSTAACFDEQGASIEMTFSNGRIIRQGATEFDESGSNCLAVRSPFAKITLDGVTLINNDSNALYTEGTVYGGNINCNWQNDNGVIGVYVGSSGKLIKSSIIGNTALLLYGSLEDCYVYSEGLYFGVSKFLPSAIFSESGIINNCIIESRFGQAILADGFTKINLSQAKSDLQIALTVVGGFGTNNALVTNSYFVSNANYAITGTGVDLYNCVAESNLSNACFIGQFAKINNTSLISYNDATVVLGDDVSIVDSTVFNYDLSNFYSHGIVFRQSVIAESIRNTIIVSNASCFAIKGDNLTPVPIYAINNIGQGCNIMFDNIINLQTLTADLYGNIIKG